MAYCGCGQSLSQEANTLIAAGPGINAVGSLDDPGVTLWADAGLAWIPYTPALGQFSLGVGGVSACKYHLDGKTLDVEVNLRLGTGGTLNAVEWEIGMPAGLVPNLGNAPGTRHAVEGDWSVFDFSANLFYEGRTFVGVLPSATPLRMRAGDDSGGNFLTVQQGTPITFAVSDEISATYRLEVL